MKRLAFREPLALALLLGLAAPALAQSGGPRTLPELKADVQERSDRHAYPVSELDAAEVREALGNLKTLDLSEDTPRRKKYGTPKPLCRADRYFAILGVIAKYSVALEFDLGQRIL
ncbi:MAG TPA: hypothetical protein VEL09_14245 [Burkholderiales bacterium]|nr:hypothetical protein [Burkholderiales bacterium]